MNKLQFTIMNYGFDVVNLVGSEGDYLSTQMEYQLWNCHGVRKDFNVC
jgi:hypothetical protein